MFLGHARFIQTTAAGASAVASGVGLNPSSVAQYSTDQGSGISMKAPVSWTNLNNMLVSDAAKATTLNLEYGSSSYTVLAPYAPNLPGGAIITGLTITFAGGPFVVQNSGWGQINVKLNLGGTWWNFQDVSGNYVSALQFFNGGTSLTFGRSAALPTGGATYSVANVNNIILAFNVQENSGNMAGDPYCQAPLDSVQLKVYYH